MGISERERKEYLKECLLPSLQKIVEMSLESIAVSYSDSGRENFHKIIVHQL